MEEALAALLKADAGVTARAGQKIAWGAQAQGAAAPYVTLHVISGPRGMHLTAPDGLTEYRVQADCWGKTYGEAKLLARAVVEVLNGHRDDAFRRVFIENERDDHDLDDPDPLYRSSLDLRFQHKA